MPKVILLSQVPIPYSKIGSWTTLYKNYLNGNHQIDYIVCKPPEQFVENVNYVLVQRSLIEKVRLFFHKVGLLSKGEKYNHYVRSLKEHIQPNEKYIIQIVDNFGVVKPLADMLAKEGIRKQVYLQFFYHGYPPFFGDFEGRWLFETIDEMVLLTHDSYKAHRDYYNILPCKFSVLHNGIDSQKFFKVGQTEKNILKERLGAANKTVFLWCSQDRPKKGLHLLLDAWKRVYHPKHNIILWVIGCDPKEPIEGVKYIGKINNDELPSYFQASDCYLFPTLWHEGFGLSLIEALHCGNYCIASALGGVPEVLQYGKLGKLIEKPNFVSEWEQAILSFLENPISNTEIPSDLYSAKKWSYDMNQIILEAKKSFY
jgi:glycosyltransferase involved in cell wall biosynthesis